MTKKDLQNGNIVVTRDGYAGVVIRGEDDYILYQELGMDELDQYHDDLIYDDEDCPDGDIMEVYRYSTFQDIDYEYPDWQRDETWIRPSAEDRRKRERIQEEKRQQELEFFRQRREENEKHTIFIITQCFYGNRTGTRIRREEIDYFLRGHLADYNPEDIADVDRRTILVPGTDNVYIVYDQTDEDNYVNVEFPEIYARDAQEYKEYTGRELTIYVSCEIPELNLTLHTRCFACRIDADGVYQSLEDEDIETFIDYFPER